MQTGVYFSDTEGRDLVVAPFADLAAATAFAEDNAPGGDLTVRDLSWKIVTIVTPTEYTED